ncbi:MAG: hypothetical protein IJD95_04215 [Clostridia bacterium]|nr:hypothetical protein [Clostridia bacterium]
MKKLLSILLCALMLIGVISGFAACSEPEDQGDRPTRPEGYYPNITLTLNNLTYVQYDPLFHANGWDLANNPYMDLVKEEMGIKFKISIDVNDISLYLEKLNAEIAAGKFADLTCVANKSFAFNFLKNANQNDLLADLTPYIKGTDESVKPSENVLKSWEQAGETVFFPGTFDGKIKAIPWINDARGTAYNFMYIRSDWLERVGKSVPTSLDELTEVMRAFKNNIDGAYGLVVDADFMAGCSCKIFDMHGVEPFGWYENENGELAYGITNSEAMKAALNVLRGWYAEGLINSDENNDFTSIGSLHYASQEIINGKAGVYFGSHSMGFVSNTLRKNSDARFVTVPLFSADGFDLAIKTDNDAYMFYAVSKENKYPESAMKLYNMYMEVIVNENNDPTYSMLTSNSKYTDELGEEKESYAPIQFAPIRTTKPFDLEESMEFLTKIQQRNSEGMTQNELKSFNEYWDAVDSNEITYKNYWTVELYKEGGVYDQLYNMYETATYARNKFFSVPTPAMDTLLGKLQATPVLDAVAIIKGEQPVDYWDTTVDTWLSTGGQTITDEVNAWWQGVNV